MQAKKQEQNIHNLHDALQLLDEAAKKSQADVKEMIQADYRNLKDTIEDIRPEIQSKLEQVGEKTANIAKEAAEDTARMIRGSAKEMDTHVKENRWLYVSGAAVAGGLLGYFLARKE